MSPNPIIQLLDIAHLADRSLPTAPDGRYDSQVRPKSEPVDPTNNYSLLHKFSLSAETLHQHLASVDPVLAGKLLEVLKSPDAVNDRTRVFNEALHVVGLIQDKDLQSKLNDALIAILYGTLQHPPATFVGTSLPTSTPLPDPTATASGTGTGPRLFFAARSADGSGNNALSPSLGQAGQPYARSVQGKYPLARNNLPDPGLVFDALLKARDWQPHPGGNSALTFAYASLVTHQLFRTDPRDMTRNNTSSYLDLSVVYGNNQAQQDNVRNKQAGRGLLWPDCFAEDRLTLVPPASAALLVIFSRNHNYCANMVLKINEQGRWSDPPPEDPAQRALQDEEIFQFARNINCGHFMATIFGDYVAGFLGLGRDGNSWSMNPFDPITDPKGQPVGRGEGNHCSVEFNLLYRWHATTAEKDVKWTESLINGVFDDKPFDQITTQDFVPGVVNAFKTVDPNPRTRTFAGLQRGPDGSFSDDDIARVLQDATESTAGTYRARGTPASLRVVEIMAMEQARKWGVCTMNEFRKFLKLKTFSTFEEWNPDPVIANAARQLYGHIDNLELYPGLQAEEITPLGPGSGICCGYTMTRAILGDAICLVRGDRFYTTDYTPGNLTAWGYQDCVRNPNNGAFGAALPKLLFRHLPRHYPYNSVYGLFPFFTPETTRQNLTKLAEQQIIQKVEDYSFTRPKAQPIPKVLDTIKGIRYASSHPEKFKNVIKSHMELCTQGYGNVLVFDDKVPHDRDLKEVMHAIFPDQKTIDGYIDWFKQKTLECFASKSYKIDGVSGTRIDLVQNVLNIVFVHWASDFFCAIPIKTKENPKGIFTEQEVYDMFTVLFLAIIMNVTPENGWTLNVAGKQVSDIVNQFIAKAFGEAVPSLSSSLVTGFLNLQHKLISHGSSRPCDPFLTKLAATNRPMRELCAQAIGLAIGSSVNFSQTTAHVLDFYLDDARAAERAEIIRLSKLGDPASHELLMGYVREGQRFNPQFAGMALACTAADTIELGSGKEPVTVQPGDIVFNSYRNAHQNPEEFPNPSKIDPTRPAASYNTQGAGFHNCPGTDFTQRVIVEIMKIVFSLKNVRRADGTAGRMESFMVNQLNTDNKMYIDNQGFVSPFPSSLTIVFD
ncbi:heme peroxidase [Abortiporus biennis]|nr:heme peroxidase [Abortiporus biennis]